MSTRVHEYVMVGIEIPYCDAEFDDYNDTEIQEKLAPYGMKYVSDGMDSNWARVGVVVRFKPDDTASWLDKEAVSCGAMSLNEIQSAYYTVNMVLFQSKILDGTPIAPHLLETSADDISLFAWSHWT